MSKTVLITGASGLIGKPLTQLLIDKGYMVHQLSRDVKKANKGVKAFKWDVSRMDIDPKCIENVDAIINLAGEGIADKAWTKKRKHEVLESRTGSIKLLYDVLKNHPDHTVKTFISASAVGYYGHRNDELLSEESKPGTDFLANTCQAWEDAADKITQQNIRLVKFRTGVVLTPEGGALPKIAQPIKMGFGSALGSGKQWMPWIHVQDAIEMYLYALENEDINGVYNMASPFPVTNKEFTKTLATQLKKSLWLPNVPQFALKVILGEMSRVVLNSNRASADKIIESGFTFKFPHLDEALKNSYDSKTSH